MRVFLIGLGMTAYQLLGGLSGVQAATQNQVDRAAQTDDAARWLPTPKQNEAAAKRFAEFLRDYYQDEETGRRMHDQLLHNIRQGRYRLSSPKEFGGLITQDVEAISKELHLEVQPHANAPTIASPPPPMPVPVRKAGPVAVERDKMWDMPAEDVARDRLVNYGIAGVKILPGNIGLIEISGFPVFTKEVPARYAAAFALVRDTSALVIDLTKAPGGHGVTGAHLASYLLDREPFLMNRFFRRGRSTLETWSFGRFGDLSYGEKRPVFIATSGDTASAAEAVTYDLKNLERVVTVGEKTAGAANPGRFFNIGYGYRAFIPQGRAESPITKTNWEGIGIPPDVAAPSSEAVMTAHRNALQAVVRNGSDRAAREIAEKALTKLQSKQAETSSP